jgi:hypothetical protein
VEKTIRSLQKVQAERDKESKAAAAVVKQIDKELGIKSKSSDSEPKREPVSHIVTQKTTSSRPKPEEPKPLGMDIPIPTEWTKVEESEGKVAPAETPQETSPEGKEENDGKKGSSFLGSKIKSTKRHHVGDPHEQISSEERIYRKPIEINDSAEDPSIKTESPDPKPKSTVFKKRRIKK